MKRVFSIVCIAQEIYRTLRYGVPISGHDYIERGNFLECEICGRRTK
jgi:hypothetical protein